MYHCTIFDKNDNNNNRISTSLFYFQFESLGRGSFLKSQCPIYIYIFSLSRTPVCVVSGRDFPLAYIDMWGVGCPPSPPLSGGEEQPPSLGGREGGASSETQICTLSFVGQPTQTVSTRHFRLVRFLSKRIIPYFLIILWCELGCVSRA